MKKYYNLIIDGEVIPFDYVEIDPITQIPSDEVSAMYETMFNLSNKCIDISYLPYDPIVGSEWDGTNFYDVKGVISIDYNKTNLTRIAFLKDSTYLGRIMYNQTDKAKMLIAALLSQPKIVLDRIE